MAIRERRRGVWQIRVYRGTDPVTGQRLWDSATVHGTKRDARLVEARMLTEQAGHATHSGTVDGVLTQVIDHLEAIGRAPSTIRNYRSLARKVADDTLGVMMWADLRVRDVDAYYRRLITAGASPPAVRHIHALLRTAGSWAVRWEWSTRNVVRDASPPSLPSRRPVSPATAQVAAALAEVDKHSETMGVAARLLGVLGCRRGEVCALRWTDIDLDEGTVSITKSIDTTPGAPMIKGTKTHQDRTLRIDEVTVRWLSSVLLGQRRAAMSAGVARVADPWLLSARVDGATPVSPDSVTGAWRRACRRAGVSGVRLLDLRHWSASVLIDAGEDPVVVAARLGHADPATTRRFYAASMETGERRAAETMGRLLRELG